MSTLINKIGLDVFEKLKKKKSFKCTLCQKACKRRKDITGEFYFIQRQIKGEQKLTLRSFHIWKKLF